MAIAVTCSCGKRLAAKDELAGRKVRCPNCRAILNIPQLAKPPIQPDSVVQGPSSPDTLAARDPSHIDLGNVAGIQNQTPAPPQFASPYTATRSARVAAKPKSNTGLIVALSIGGGITLLIVVVAAVIWILGSGRDNRVAIVEPSDGAAAAQNPPPNRLGLTEEECERVAADFCAAIEQRDVAAARGIIDFNEMLRLATAGIGVSKKFEQSFMAGFNDSLKNRGFEQQLITFLEDGGTYRVLRAHRVGNEMRVWVRLVSETMGLVYHDLIFFRGADGLPHVADIYVVGNGELMSQTMRRLYIPLAAQDNRSILQRLTGWESDFVKNLDQFRQLVSQVHTNPTASLATYHRLPESLRKNKSVLIMRIAAASNANEQEYMSALRDFKTLYPDDPAVDVLSIDFYLLRQEFDEALGAVDSVDRAVGGDPYLHAMRSAILLEKGDMAGAKRAANLAIEEDATIEDGFWSLIAIDMAQNDFASMFENFKRIDQAFEMEWEDFDNIPENAPFVQSPHYQQWLEYLKSKQ